MDKKAFKSQFYFDGTLCGELHASAALTYDFQKAFYEGIGPVDDMKGKVMSLDSLLQRKAGEWDSWHVRSADQKPFAWYCERIN